MRPFYNVRSRYTGANNQNEYTFDFKITSASHLLVIMRDDSGVVVQDNRDDDTFIDNIDFDPQKGGVDFPGTLTLVDDLPTDYVLDIILADDQSIQDSRYKDQGDFSFQRLEDSFDAAIGAIQRMQFRIKSSLRLPDYIDPDQDNISMEMDFITGSYAGKYLKFKDDGTGLEVAEGTSADLTTLESDVATLQSDLATLQTEVDSLPIPDIGEDSTFEIVGGTIPGTVTYDERIMRWVRNGVMVFLEVAVSGSSHDGTGQIQIPLPFAAAAGGAVYGTPVLYGVMKPTTDYQIQATVNPSSNYISLAQHSKGSGAAINLGNVALNFEDQPQTFSFSFALWYRTEE